MSLADQQWCPTSVQVTVLQARGLRTKGKNGTNDAYALMQVGKEKYQTSVVEKSVAPVWKEEAAFDLPPLHFGGGGGGERGTLHVHVLHRALVGPDKQLGQAVINLLQLSEDKTRNKTEWFKLLDKSGKADKDRGEVLVDIQFMRNNMTASMFDLSAAGKSRSRLGKFKDKVRGKKKESDTVSSVVPSFSQVLTDSEDEANGDGNVAAGKDEKKKKHKIKSLFSPKSNLQRNMSQSMSVLPAKNSSLSGSQSSGLNVDSSEGKKKFKFMIHKRSGSSDSKDSSAGQKHGAIEQSNLCINGSHVYCEEPQPRTSRIGSNFSLASSGHGSMEDVPESSPPSVDSLRGVTQYSPWTEEEEEEAEAAEVENTTEDVDELRREEEERIRMEEERRRKEEEEERVRRQEALERLAEEKRRQEEEEREMIEKVEEEERIRREEERKRGEEQERVRREEEERERLAAEKRRLEEQERKRMEEEEERVRVEEERALEERRRQEEEERARRQEEERKLEEEKVRLEEERRIEEKVRKEEEERIRKEEASAEEETRKEEEQRVRREEEREKKRRHEEEEKRQREEEERIRVEEERIRVEEERAQEERRREEEEERVRREEEEREKKRTLVEQERRQQEEEERIRKEEERRQEEEERARKEKEEYERLIEEKRKLEEKERERIETEEKIRREEEERIRMEEERREEEEAERVRKEEEREEKRRLEEQERTRIEEEEKRQREEEERIRKEKERRQEEEERARKEKEEYERLVEEKRRLEEQERIRKEEQERFEDEEKRRRQEEEERAEKEEMERLAQEKRRREEEEKRRIEEEEEEERIRRVEKAERERKEEETRKLEKEKLARDAEERKMRENKTKDGHKSEVGVARTADVTSSNPFDENFLNNPFEEIPSSRAGPDSDAATASNDQQGCQSAVSSVRSRTASTDEKDLISAQREKRPAPQPPGRSQAESQREQDVVTRHLAQMNKQSNDKDIKTASVLPQRATQMIAPLSQSPADTTDTQSEMQSSSTKGTASVAKHSKRPAPSRPRSVEEEPSSEPKTANNTQRGGSETKHAPVVYGSNPFEDDEDELTAEDDAKTPGNSGSVHWPPAVSQAADKDAASQAKLKSSKIARAPPPPAKKAATSSTLIHQNTDGGHVTDDAGAAVPDNGAHQACDPQPEAVISVPDQGTSRKEPQPGRAQEVPSTTSRRLQPVKPLNPLDQQSVSNVQGGKYNQPTGILSEVQEKTKVNDTGLKGPYSQLTREELISLVLKQEKQLTERDKKISELEKYIDNLLVRVMEEKPSILMSLSALMKAV
ncbi:calponin homology domain-containing protein DDB_G0272472 [Seriola aureovittata]|uniref:calponin homology domain-containing protein DDB_G0272472 n=1 Tax=Seriola aureovittata TaxID=2871759 RepID=UPI0024BD9D9F|nr:calponin homology domain-containing protein DDB_G0272472 [Seriola aureovittata]